MKVRIKDIKAIKDLELEIPEKSGIYGIVGNNGCGKSTLLSMIAHTLYIKIPIWTMLKKGDYKEETSRVTFINEGIKNEWKKIKGKQRWKNIADKKYIALDGLYEGSLFFGTRFNDSTKVDELLQNGEISTDEIIEADEYVKNAMSKILHGVPGRYENLKRLRSIYTAKKLGLVSIPYFIEIENDHISQYRMSSGECLLASLLHFIYTVIIKEKKGHKKKFEDTPILMLIDEIEVALHPIAVERLLKLLEGIIKEKKVKHEIRVVLTTHSPQVIRKIDPKNMFQLKNENGIVEVINPCYPSYAIREVYKHDGYDNLILVEDELTKKVVDKVIFNLNLGKSKLNHVVPVGGWKQVLDLQNEMYKTNMLGYDKTITSVLDGDVKENSRDMKYISENYGNAKKLFLPIKSIEKYLFEKVYENVDMKIKRHLNDKYFIVESIDEILADFDGKSNKKLYKLLIENLEKRGTTEKEFVSHFCNDLFTLVDFSNFEVDLKRILA